MPEIVVRFDLHFSRRAVGGALAAAMLLCAASELDSESVTLSTYYPAPSGVYTKMITTADTWLARDVATNGGRVSIGSPNSPAAELDITSPSGTEALIVRGKSSFLGRVKITDPATCAIHYFRSPCTTAQGAFPTTDNGCGPSSYATFTPGIYSEGASLQSRAGVVTAYPFYHIAQDANGGGANWGLIDVCSGNYWCCPR